jgi:hypothetical protein
LVCTKAPAKIHFQKLKHIALYLHITINWGILFWRSKPNPSLPHVPNPTPRYDSQLPPFPASTDPFQLCGYIDSAHANELLRCRSATGYGFMLAGGVIAYRSKTQPITATSSTEAEFIAAVSAGKVARYLRSILDKTGLPPRRPHSYLRG